MGRAAPPANRRATPAPHRCLGAWQAADRGGEQRGRPSRSGLLWGREIGEGESLAVETGVAMAREYDKAAAVAVTADHPRKPLDPLIVHRGGWLIQQPQRCRRRQQPRERYAAALTGREQPRRQRRETVEAERGNGASDG